MKHAKSTFHIKRRTPVQPYWQRSLMSQLIQRLHLPVPWIYAMANEQLQWTLRHAPISWVCLTITAVATITTRIFQDGVAANWVLLAGLIVWLAVARRLARPRIVRIAGSKARQLARLRR